MQTAECAKKFRAQFPFFQSQNSEPQAKSIYLDNAATTHICQPALNAINQYYQTQHANVHRSSHKLALGTTNTFEQIRKQTACWLNAFSEKEIIWTKGATESANLIASSLAYSYLKPGDEVIISLTEHHAHFVTWQQIAKRFKLTLKVVGVTSQQQINLVELEKLLTDKTRVMAFCHVSNATGVKQPVTEIMQLLANYPKVISVIDGSQAVNHLAIDLQALNCDFYFFSAHKMYAGTGLGILYGKQKWLEILSPYQYGGEMVETVSIIETKFNQLPYKFEAGTPNIAAVFAFSSTLSFLNEQPLQIIREYETKLLDWFVCELKNRPNIQILATSNLIGAVSFTINDWHSADAAEILNQMGIALRVGKHCAMPLMQKISPNGSLRVSIAGYNLFEELNYFLSCLDELDNYL